MIDYKKIDNTTFICTLYLEKLFNKVELKLFNAKWKEFLKSDDDNSIIFSRKGNIITYPHKSWIPQIANNKPRLLFLAGNPAPHSVKVDTYYAYEGKGVEHRFWKVLRDLGFTDLFGHDLQLKTKIIECDYNSPFVIALEAVLSFPSTASKPKWSGMAGVERLFGRRAFQELLQYEKLRVIETVNNFFPNGGTIIAMQKDAYNAVSSNTYNIKHAVENKLRSKFSNTINIYGTPPTRWLYTKKMKTVLTEIRNEILLSESKQGFK